MYSAYSGKREITSLSLKPLFYLWEETRTQNREKEKDILSLETQKLCQDQTPKPSRISRTSTSNTDNIRSKIIQTTRSNLKVHWNQAQKPPETSTNHKSVKLYGFKPLKHRRISTTNLQTRRTHEEHEEQRIFNKLIARDSL
ncbi:hypothetical protein ACB092_07G140400 [Castanea dentata]